MASVLHPDLEIVRMPRSLPQLALCAALVSLLGLAACNRERPADVATTPAVQPPSATAPAPAVTPAPEAGLARFDGYGDMHFGMTAAEATKAWGGDLNGKPGAGEVCYYLNPVSNPSPAYFAFMIEADKFVRYDVANVRDSAPGGGQPDMSMEQIEQLYPGQTRERPSAAGGRSLRVKGNAGVAIVFDIGVDGRVSRWRVGQVPQVDYGHGCS